MANVKTLLLTRPQAQSERLAAQIGDAARCIISPLIKIENTGTLPDTGFERVIFTSANGVRAYIAAHGPLDRPCYCVGDKTAALARTFGMFSYSAKGNAADLIKLMQALPTGNAVHICGEHTTGDIADTLTQSGHPTIEAVLYKQNQLTLTAEAIGALGQGLITGIPFYSPRTARILRSEIAPFNIANITAFCLSDNVAAEIHEAGFACVLTAAKPNNAAMISILDEYLS